MDKLKPYPFTLRGRVLQEIKVGEAIPSQENELIVTKILSVKADKRIIEINGMCKEAWYPMTKQVRDWNKDMELLQKKPKFTIDEVNHIIYNVAPYWLQQYATEKQRADKAEGLWKAFEATAKVAGQALKETEAREKKLREAIEEVKYALPPGSFHLLKSRLASLYPKEEEAKPTQGCPYCGNKGIHYCLGPKEE